MGQAIQEISIEGFKSIQKLDHFALRNLNILIGANGAGKTNFVELFRMIREMAEERLQNYVAKAGGGDGLFFEGPKASPAIKVKIAFTRNEWTFSLEPTADGRVVNTGESMTATDQSPLGRTIIGPSGPESSLKIISNFHGPNPSAPSADTPAAKIVFDVFNAVTNVIAFHFHDTGPLSPMRREQAIEDSQYLRPDASNIAPFLRNLRDTSHQSYLLIRDTIRIVAPFFDDLLLKDRIQGPATKVTLDWKQKGSDFPFQAWQLSDGTLRFICLATALLQPSPPATIIIDEPELGLHPHALEVLAGLVQRTSERTQIIISTQSAPLLSQFEPEDVITVTRQQGSSVFARLDPAAFSEWIADYSLGELWQKNVIEAGASSD